MNIYTGASAISEAVFAHLNTPSQKIGAYPNRNMHTYNLLYVGPVFTQKPGLCGFKGGDDKNIYT
ncbi:MAG: hypothetical protein ACXACY_23500, partial [Candidatus Hodarchaeales archaeon]